ncbi:haloacid dehalogenase type II [Streptomyces sp. NBC_00083]|uniref:haloacid dehalogenase type II n=1 Tax=Streptomyces sp. NBC_00083 TaxID=2975647 RepID=UPI00225C04CC|nr:haloacid dehalogenase type II [Streptomyces sp. NBC_00083]MCX5384452.1 haloacid dehalogenase type II [Streptomyces sp. NBC_00083]
MAEAGAIDVVVFDVLGTMVNEPGGLRTAVREAVGAAEPGAGGEARDGTGDEAGGAPDEAFVDQLVAVWQEHVAQEQRRIDEGERSYANSEVLDREAARLVAERAGLRDPEAVARLATASQRLDPWDDSAAGLARFARRFPVLGLTHASRATLLRLNAYADLRWHQALSAEDAHAHKPAPEVYRLALDAAQCPPERALMVAAHAWDLRGAQAVGMHTAYVRRPVGDPPRESDTFTWRADSLSELATALIPA